MPWARPARGSAAPGPACGPDRGVAAGRRKGSRQGRPACHGLPATGPRLPDCAGPVSGPRPYPARQPAAGAAAGFVRYWLAAHWGSGRPCPPDGADSPRRRLMSRISPSSKSSTCPCMWLSLVQSCRRFRQRRKLVLPEPERPSRTLMPWRGSSRSTWCRMARPLRCRHRSWMRTRGVIAVLPKTSGASCPAAVPDGNVHAATRPAGAGRRKGPAGSGRRRSPAAALPVSDIGQPCNR